MPALKTDTVLCFPGFIALLLTTTFKNRVVYSCFRDKETEVQRRIQSFPKLTQEVAGPEYEPAFASQLPKPHHGKQSNLQQLPASVAILQILIYKIPVICIPKF